MRACCQKQQLHSNIAAFTNSLASTQMTSLATLRLNPTNQQFASICSHLSQVYLSTTSVWSSVYSKDHVGNKQSKNNTNFEVKAGAHKKTRFGQRAGWWPSAQGLHIGIYRQILSFVYSRFMSTIANLHLKPRDAGVRSFQKESHQTGTGSVQLNAVVLRIYVRSETTLSLVCP